MDEMARAKISKYLSKYLRHEPERLGLTLAPGGWVGAEELLTACAEHGFRVSRDELDEVVAMSDKQRFAFDETRTRIRANQGHSTEVDLQLEAVAPPSKLYHGTARSNVNIIKRDGILRMSRHHVHLSPDTESATRVGQRHGKPVIFVIDAAAMHAAGREFFRSANGVWLVDSVPPAFLSIAEANG